MSKDDSGWPLPAFTSARHVVYCSCPNHLQAFGGFLESTEGNRSATQIAELDKDYGQLQAMVNEAREGVASISESAAAAIADQSMVFALGEREMPFSNQNFLLSFSLPNFYFHATTIYDLLRETGVPLGKMDFLGKMKMG